MNKRNNPPMPPFDIRPMRKETKPHAVHIANPPGSKLLRRCARASAGARMSYAASAAHMAALQ